MEIGSTYSILPLVSSIFVFVLGFFVWLKKPRELLHILFFMYAFVVAIWLFGTFLLFNATTEADQIQWDRFIYVGIVFSPIFLYHFGLVYSGRKEVRVPLVLGYLTSFAFLYLSQTDYFVKGIYHYSWGIHTIAQIGHHIFMVYFAIYFGLFFITLGKHYSESSGDRRSQIKYVLIGYAVLTAIGTLGFLPAYGIPIYPVIFLSGIPFVGFLAYAIIRHNALDFKTITAEVVVSILNLILFFQIFISQTSFEMWVRIISLVAVAVFSIILVRSIHKEIRRREEVTNLAHSLEQANIRLKELDRQKTDFLSIAAHQLRTPLSILNGYIELIRDGAYGKVLKKTKEILDNMDESNMRLVKLVDEFLDITRIEQGRTKYDFAEKDVNAIVASVADELRDRAQQKEIKIATKPVKEPALAVIDEEKVRHVVFNFVDNAIKYSDKGVINLEVEIDNGITVRVKDHGFGFDRIDEVNFFQKFYRGVNVKGTNVNGTGLGLYVCRKFIEGHQGRIWAHSPGLGKGSEFGFWVPLRPHIKKEVKSATNLTAESVM